MNRLFYQVVFLILIILGLVFIGSSVTLGSSSANAFLQSYGGSMDTARFMIVYQEYINLYKLIGLISAGIGGFGFIKCITYAQRHY